MNERRLEELAQEELDGMSTPERSAELKAMLSGSEEARVRYEEIHSVFRILASHTPVEPPASLKANVLAALDARRPRRAPSAWYSGVATRLHLGRRTGTFIGFAAGALVALIFAVAVPQVWQGGSDRLVSGTIGAARGALVDRQRFDLGEGSVDCSAWRTGERVTVRIVARSAAATHLRLEFDPTRLTLVATRPPQGDARWTTSASRVEFEGLGDVEGELELIAPRDAAPIAVVVRGVGDSIETSRKDLKLH